MARKGWGDRLLVIGGSLILFHFTGGGWTGVASVGLYLMFQIFFELNIIRHHITKEIVVNGTV
jgi:hypothetical protein